MAQGSMVKEFHKLLKNVSKMSEHQASVCDWNDDDVSTFKIEIKPHGGVYKGGTFTFKVTLCDEFPQEAPQIRCETPIYHPNIDPTEEYDETNICLNMFQSDMWQEAYGMDGVVQGLLFLFYEPNLEDPLSPYFDGNPVDDFENKVLLSLKGEEVEGVKYPWNYGEKKEDENGDKEEGEELTKSEENGNESRKDNYVGKPEERRNDDSVEKTEETKSDIVPKSDDVAKDLDDVSERNEGDDSENRNDCSSELCNNTDTSNTNLVSENVEETVITLPGTPKGESLGVTIKTKEVNAQAPVASQTSHVQPDVIPLSNDDCSASCPDVVTMTTDYHTQEAVICREVQTVSVQKIHSDVNLLDKQNERSILRMHSYDAVLPEMNLVFAMLHGVTETVKPVH